ncbi:MAG: tetraacyldisaccharide 4'-kinase [Pirellulales bacterium]
MFSPSTFRDLVSGRRRGMNASLLRGLLRLAEFPYGWVVRYRNRRYDRHSAPIHTVNVPVVCVGNLTLGGTGKTPLVEWLARRYGSQGVRVAIVSRGYGARAGIPNDEALELAQALPGVPHVQNADRVSAAVEAINQYATELIVLDDGFQHRRLGRDLDVVLLDASEPFGMEHLFPRGTLREPLDSLRRADAVVLSRATLLDQSGRDTIRQRVACLAPQAVWCEVDHQPSCLVNQSGQQMPLEHLAGRPLVAFCGIGNPIGFRHTLTALGCQPIAWREFADHHAYPRHEINALESWASTENSELAVCTRKDLVKLKTDRLGTVPLWALAIELQFLRGQSEFESLLMTKLRVEN